MTSAKRQLSGAPLIGRRIGIAAFWFMAVFVTTASARSVILELYGSPESVGPGDDGRCKVELRKLHEDLLDRAASPLRSADAESGFQTWLRDWDRRFASTQAVCAGLRSTRETLQTLRKKLDAKRRDDARELLPLTERIERALSRAVPRSTPSRKT
jgi:hypothetical protein